MLSGALASLPTPLTRAAVRRAAATSRGLVVATAAHRRRVPLCAAPASLSARTHTSTEIAYA
jgi:hypothetical protein